MISVSSRQKIISSFIKFCFISACVIVLLTGSTSQSAQTNQNTETISEIVDSISELSFLKWKNDPNLLKEQLPELYQTLSKERDAIFESSLFVYRVECLMFMEKREEGLEITRKQLQNTIDKPDFLTLYIQLGGGTTLEERRKIWNEHGRILPISHYGVTRNSLLSEPGFRVSDPLPLSVPYTYQMQEKQLEIAKIYEKEGFIDESINVYIESYYSMGTSILRPNILGGLWLKVAELERKRGNKVLAVRAYLKAVRNWYEYAGEVKKGIEDALAETKPKHVEIPEPTLEKEVALKIAELYKQLNLHPMALAALERSEKDTGVDLGSQKKEILKEWTDLLNRIAKSRWVKSLDQAREMNYRFYILGQNVFEVKDWAKIPILRPTDTFWK